MKPRVKYIVVVKYRDTSQEWVAFEDKSEDKARSEAKSLKSKYLHLIVKLFKVVEEQIKL